MPNRPVDEQVYERELLPWLPPRIFDCHAHIGLAEHMGPVSPDRLAANWALEVGVEQSWEQLRENYRTLFPRQEVRALVFGGVFRETNVERNNEYVLNGAKDSINNAAALLVTRPEWEASRIAEGLAKGFKGIKPYPDLAPQGSEDAGIFDFVPREHLAALNGLGGIMMLHLPRPGRLADPDNIRETIEIAEDFPNIRLIVAHIGRAFCFPTAERGLPHFVHHSNVLFDTSANLNADVFTYALETVGPDRLLFGSDLPVTMMRGFREHVGERYINYTDAPYSWNVNRKTAEEESKYTYFLYEELRALISAVKRAGLGKEALEKVMYANAANLLGE